MSIRTLESVTNVLSELVDCERAMHPDEQLESG
jgi:hypothetical protein